MLRPGEIIIDNFAGGGGASKGIEDALGRSVDVAINHDAQAVAMHTANHPDTKHLCQDVWEAEPREVAAGRPVGLAWFSPDCKHFSKAKGGKPVEKKIRGLAWVVIRWAATVKPRIIILENVEEFQTWGPLVDNKPCKVRRGRFFRIWVGQLRKLGYVVEWRELRACDYGAPTIRKRLFLIARRDGEPIVWPTPSHGPDRTAHRTAADCIDWSIPCPSIFERDRPLAEATMRRIARGIQRYVIDAANPFIVPVCHTKNTDNPCHPIDEPMRTVTTAKGGEFALVSPTLVGVGGRAGQSRPRSADEPMGTQTAKADTALVAPLLTKFQENSLGQRPDEPIHTVMAGAPRFGVVAPTLIQTGYGEREGQAPRAPGLDKPLGTVVAGGAKHAVVAAHLQRQFGKSIGQEADEPAPTVTAGGGGKTALVAAFMAQHNTGVTGHPADKPLSTIVHRGTQQNLATAHLLKLRGTSRDGQPVDEPSPTVTASGTHLAEVRAFLVKYYGTASGQDLFDSLHSVTTKHRFGLVTVAGVDYQIVDIGMRMLQPRELFRAQGFPDSYVIDPLFEGKRLTKTAQVRMCGNSVCPPIAEAVVRANVGASAHAATQPEAGQQSHG